MRIIGGEAGGRRLLSPPGDFVRPTSDRAREAIFSMLDSMGVVHGAKVVDLFAGTGALGIEALSRGAASAVFVEKDPRAVETIRKNLALGGFGTDRSRVVRSDATSFSTVGGPWDLALCDPPYRFEEWHKLFEALPASVLVAESERVLEEMPGWSVVRSRRYGISVVTLMLADSSHGAAPRHDGSSEEITSSLAVATGGSSR